MAFLKNSMLFLLLLLILPETGNADSSIQLYEQEVKVGLLYNFVKYTEWPTSDQVTPKIDICMYGNDPLMPYLKKLEGRSVNQKDITIRTVNNVADSATCSLIFISANNNNDWPELRQFLKNKHILTASDVEGFTSSGGMIGFDKQDNRIQVELNLEIVNAAQLHVEERLLKLVKLVHITSHDGGQ